MFNQANRDDDSTDTAISAAMRAAGYQSPDLREARNIARELLQRNGNVPERCRPGFWKTINAWGRKNLLRAIVDDFLDRVAAEITAEARATPKSAAVPSQSIAAPATPAPPTATATAPATSTATPPATPSDSTGKSLAPHTRSGTVVNAGGTVRTAFSDGTRKTLKKPGGRLKGPSASTVKGARDVHEDPKRVRLFCSVIFSDKPRDIRDVLVSEYDKFIRLGETGAKRYARQANVFRTLKAALPANTTGRELTGGKNGMFSNDELAKIITA